MSTVQADPRDPVARSASAASRSCRDLLDEETIADDEATSWNGPLDEDLAAWEGREYPDAWMVHNLMVRHPVVRRVPREPRAARAPVAAARRHLHRLRLHVVEHAAVGRELLAPRPRRLAAGDSRLLDERRRDGRARRLHRGERRDAVPAAVVRTRRAARRSRSSWRRASRRSRGRARRSIFNARTWHMGGMNRTDRPGTRSR